jgi:hypothetical protein
MNSKFTVNFSLVALALSNILLFTSVVQAKPSVGGGMNSGNGSNNSNPAPKSNSSVKCENLETVAYSNNNKAVIISWNTNDFGSNYTPADRCNIVSNKLNALVQSNGGKFKNLRLTNGPVNGRIVICSLKPGEFECTGNNLLFTLKRENEKNAGRILGQLLNIGVAGASTINEDSGEQVIVDLGQWAERNLGESQAIEEQPQNPENIQQVVTPKSPTGGGFE